MANETLERARKFGESSSDQEFNRYLKRAREYAEEFEFSVPDPEAEVPATAEEGPGDFSEPPARDEAPVRERSAQQSFFDQIQ